jgi:hypothetical protein
MQRIYHIPNTNKAKEWKSMVVERGKTCSRSKEKLDFNGEFEK